MFAIYDTEGLRFRDTLESLQKIRKVQEWKRPIVSLDTRRKATTNQFRGNSELFEASQAYRKKRQINDREAITHVYQLMSHPVETIQQSLDILSAWERFHENRYHQLPVLDQQQRILGMLTERDLLKFMLVDEDKIKCQPNKIVADAMSDEVITADPATDVRRIANVMVDYRLSAVPIVDEKDILIGLVSRSDILRAAAYDPPLNAHLSLWT